MAARQRSPPHSVSASDMSTPSPTPERRQGPPRSNPPARAQKTSPLSVLLILAALGTSYLALQTTPLAQYLPGNAAGLGLADLLDSLFRFGSEVQGHADFGDGRKLTCPKAFAKPTSLGLYHVNVNLGNGGPEPDLSGGMIPNVGTPFGMTRWTAQTRLNYVSMCPYNQTDTRISGFIGTHQPAVWMGESGPVQLGVGLGDVVTDFHGRGLEFDRRDEYASQNYYSNVLQSKHGNIEAEMAATSRVGHLRFTFRPEDMAAPFVVLDASRVSAVTSNPANVSLPIGHVEVDFDAREISGWNDERQDHILVSDDLPAKGFKGYFVARFSEPFAQAGISHSGELEDAHSGDGQVLSAYVTFARGTLGVDVRVGVSFISVEQARRNIDLEVPDGQSLEATSAGSRVEWAAKLDLLSVQGATPSNLTVLYTGFSRTLVYPYEVHENAGTVADPKWRYYSGYLDAVTEGQSYSGYSIWDTFRATTAWQLLVAPERVGPMITSMLQDYRQGGWLPMWKNIVETNIMVGTHADSIIAQAMSAGVPAFDWDLAWEAVRKNAYTPPDRDTELRFFDREEHTPQEVRAGLTEYMAKGWVADDLHSEAGSRTLDYAYDDHAAAIVAAHVGANKDAKVLAARAKNYRNIWNNETGFMEARRADGSWAGWWAGWTEGDHWAYSLTVMHDTPGLIELMGGDDKFVDFIDRHFDGGHNLHTNEPSHHIPYLYSFAPHAAHKSQEWVRNIGENEYDDSAEGLSGNEDCGQMSAWYLFSALGFYPVDPASATYVVGAPFFDRIQLRLPSMHEVGAAITVIAPGASKNKYVKGLKVDSRKYGIHLSHADIAEGASIEFEMADTPQHWPQS
ncbi:hypothetical protein CcaverHIS002_0407020 [Cutaneotrichosporon cavernicola]|uniref:Glycoside hydrolase family 92 protein n=1 Tax=Cutaneotrichosporon cavernicola TaxID=279322 RepID=A0AA48L4L8_9TREE|nr:uncharacterized protein CcaverHIS019_0407040 [Cutaneotrichosporon cavernicola]BEI84098.1 hypothetical protein CcaverHIS002_0407020 [Cutaneotrichosporon cavernicola]BEI91884.1 hypothetical protein CcaverHIS019_0407040 [Cutaneotrichosporon cavernicola]BEI99656.1 hypothetical protein CcaverHIS631_0406990 [Cutaneotrichosporon cavernicola]BEJ07430.1 hypothetical protein CcaverHIS641_0406990 [Cutaneotrichosporon cavernicola]